jgi:hypothetical protein
MLDLGSIFKVGSSLGQGFLNSCLVVYLLLNIHFLGKLAHLSNHIKSLLLYSTRDISDRTIFEASVPSSQQPRLQSLDSVIHEPAAFAACLYQVLPSLHYFQFCYYA